MKFKTNLSLSRLLTRRGIETGAENVISHMLSIKWTLFPHRELLEMYHRNFFVNPTSASMFRQSLHCYVIFTHH